MGRWGWGCEGRRQEEGGVGHFDDKKFFVKVTIEGGPSEETVTRGKGWVEFDPTRGNEL